MRTTEGTRRIVARYVRTHPDPSIGEIARETGIPAYIVKGAIQDMADKRLKK